MMKIDIKIDERCREGLGHAMEPEEAYLSASFFQFDPFYMCCSYELLIVLTVLPY